MYISLKQLDFCCLRLLQLVNIAKIRLRLAPLVIEAVSSPLLQLSFFFEGAKIIQGRKLHKDAAQRSRFKRIEGTNRLKDEHDHLRIMFQEAKSELGTYAKFCLPI